MIPEKWVPVFGKDHARPISWSGMTIRRNVIPLQSFDRRPPACAGYRSAERGRLPGSSFGVVNTAMQPCASTPPTEPHTVLLPAGIGT